MITITKERIELFIKSPLENGLTRGEQMELARIALASLDAETVRYLNKFSGTCVTLEQQPNAADDVAVYIPLYATPPVQETGVYKDMLNIISLLENNEWAEHCTSTVLGSLLESEITRLVGKEQPASEREQIRREHAEWSDKTFGDVGPVGSLKHLSKEAVEAAAEPDDLSEWADMQFLLWDAQRRTGITDEQITQAMIEKLAINKARLWPEPKDGEPRLHIKEQPAPVMPAELHPDTQKLVADFCTALAEKLYKAQLKYGYDADWKQDGWSTQCQAHFHQHIAKGDPRDVAAYCAFMWYHGWKTESVSGPVVPEEVMPGGLAYSTALPVFEGNDRDKIIGYRCFISGDTRIVESQEQAYVDGKAVVNACRAVMLQSKYRDLSQPVDPQISEYEKIMLRAGWVMVPVEPTSEMINAALKSHLIVFNPVETYSVMLAAAPQPEASDGK